MPVLHTDDHGQVYSRSGSKKLWLRFKGRSGQEIRRSSGAVDLADAIRQLHQSVKTERSITFLEAVVEFFDVGCRSLKPSTVKGYRSTLRKVDPLLRDKTLEEIDRDLIKGFINQRRRQVKDATVRRDLAFISTVFSYAMNNMEGAPEANPVIRFSKRFLKETKRDRYLTEAEYRRLLDACLDDIHRGIIQVACLTGMRAGELKAIRKSMLNLDRREIILPGSLTKNGKPRAVPLSDAAARTLEELCEKAPGDLIFWHRNNARRTPKPYTEFNGFFVTARKRAGLEDVRFHDLRHTFASWWVQGGGDLMALRNILGHQSMQMVERYAYLDTEATHRAVGRVEFPHSFRTIEGE